ncbi:hypothetical protein WA538_003918, partial [Blastocystis sp. DL]
MAEECLLESYEYLLHVPGKNIRSLLIDVFQQWLKIPEDVLVKIRDIINSLHVSSLMIDDIEDNSKQRRGVPVAHEVFGVASTINAANYVYFLALEKCRSLHNDDALDVFIRELISLHHGQGMDIYWRDHLICPSEDEYKQMISDKTGGLLRLSIGLMQAFSDNHQDYTHLLYLIGVFYQIRDDYINICSEKYAKEKCFFEDITEGKFSYPIIQCIHKNPSDHRLINILKQRTDKIELKLYAKKVIEEYGCLEDTRLEALRLADEICDEIKRLGGNDQLENVVKMLTTDLEQ